MFVDGALWEAVAEGEPVPAGERIEVVAMDGLLLRVRPAVSDTPILRDSTERHGPSGPLADAEPALTPANRP